MKFQLDLTRFFEKECKTLIASYKGLLTRKQGIALDNAPSNKESTIKRKGKDHWLVDTGETRRKGFLSEANRLKMKVYANTAKHSGRSTYMTKSEGKKIYVKKDPPTYEQIFLWHNTANDRYSGIFQMIPAGSKLFERLDKEINKQVQDQIKKNIADKYSRIK